MQCLCCTGTVRQHRHCVSWGSGKLVSRVCAEVHDLGLKRSMGGFWVLCFFYRAARSAAAHFRAARSAAAHFRAARSAAALLRAARSAAAHFGAEMDPAIAG